MLITMTYHLGEEARKMFKLLRDTFVKETNKYQLGRALASLTLMRTPVDGSAFTVGGSFMNMLTQEGL